MRSHQFSVARHPLQARGYGNGTSFEGWNSFVPEVPAVSPAIKSSKPERPSRSTYRSERFSSQSLGKLESDAIAIIGYQLWTPLSAIRACLELLESPESIGLDERQLMVELALKETVGLEELVRECLALFVAEGEEGSIACPLLPTLELLQTALLDASSSFSRGGKLDCRDDEEATLSTALDIGYESESYGGSSRIDSWSKSVFSPPLTASGVEREEYLQRLRHKLIAIVGHELRTPLCSLKVCLETFVGEPQQFCEDDLLALVELARMDLERLHHLVDQFFTLSRLERGLILQTRSVVDLEKTLDLVVSGLQTQHRDVPTIGISLPESMPLLRVDEDKLLLALGQLLDNAFRFTGTEGTIAIEVRPFPPGGAESEHRMVEIIVADTGRGIDPARLEQVFDCFYQEEDYLRRTVGGTGIGLSICRKLIEGMGGKIWARSSGKALGSRIHLTLPTVGYCAV